MPKCVEERKIYKSREIIDDNPNVEDLTDMTDEEFDRLIRSHNVLGQNLREASQKSHQGSKLPSIEHTPTGRLPKLRVYYEPQAHLTGTDRGVQVSPSARAILEVFNKIGSGYQVIGYDDAEEISRLTPRAYHVLVTFNKANSGHQPVTPEEATRISKQWWRPVNWHRS